MRTLKQAGLKLHSETIGILDTVGSRGFAPNFITCPTEIPPCHPPDTAGTLGGRPRPGNAA